MSDTLESLEIEVKHNATGADKTVAKLTDSIREMSKAVSDALTNLREYSTLLKAIGGSVQKALSLPKLSKTKGPLDNDLQEKIENANRYEIALHKVSDAVSKMNKAFKTGNENAAWRAREKELNAEAQVDKYRPVPAISENLQGIIKTASEVDVLNHKLAGLKDALDDAFAKGDRDKAYQLRGEIIKVEGAIAKLSNTTKKSTGTLANFYESLKRIAFYRFVRTIIKEITQAFSEGLEKAYIFSFRITTEGHRFAVAMDTMTSKANQMKGQLGSAFIGLLTAVEPILEQLIAIVVKAADAVSQFFAAFTGETYLKAIAANAKFADDTAKGAKAAKEWKNQLLGFDEINRLEDKSSAGKAGKDPLEGYDFVDTPLDKWAMRLREAIQWVQDHLDTILPIVEAIGLAFVGWKIADKVTDLFGLSVSLKTIFGIAMAVAGAFLLIKGWIDAISNGVSRNNLKEMLLGTTILASGLAIAFGTVGAAVGLLIGGFLLLVAGIKDFIEKGKLTPEAFTAIVTGVLSVGAAILLLTGNWIPLLVVGILACLFSLALFTGHGEELINGLKDVFEGFVTFVSGVFSQDWDTALEGIEQTGIGLEQTYTAIIETIEDSFINALKVLNMLTGGVLSPLFDYWESEFESTISYFRDSLDGFLLFVEGVFTLDWEKAWNGIQLIVYAVVNRIISMIENAANFIIDGLNKIKIGGESLFNIERLSLPRMEDIFGNVGAAGKQKADYERNSGGRTYRGATRDHGIGSVDNSLFITGQSESEIVNAIGGRALSTNNADILVQIQSVLDQIAATRNANSGVNTAVLNVNGREFARATFSDAKAVARERGVSLVVT